MEVLPDLYEYKETRLQFYWRFALQGTMAPPDIEETVAGHFERDEYDRAEVFFEFLTDCFGGYAEDYNYPGLISLERDKPDEAVVRFQTDMDLGRKQFPKRMAKSRYWNDLSTRPYMRAMKNLTITLNRNGQFDEALRFCEKLERECGDSILPMAYRTSIYLNTNRWQEAADSAMRLKNIDPSESLAAEFALYEAGRKKDATAYFLHAALSYPRAVKMAIGIRTSSPKNHVESRDHNVGLDIHRDLAKYLRDRGRNARRFFKRFIGRPHVEFLLSEVEDVLHRRYEQQRIGGKETFERML